jgi:hypothetical protein
MPLRQCDWAATRWGKKDRACASQLFSKSINIKLKFSTPKDMLKLFKVVKKATKTRDMI